VVQVSPLLYAIASRMDGRDLVAIADSVASSLNLRITSEHIAYVAEHKLAPLGVVADRDGSTASLERVDALLALKFRAGVLPERAVYALAGLLRPLFLPAVAIGTLAALAAFDVWFATSHGIGAGLRVVLHRPVLGLALFGLVMISLVFHECGHAAACRYGGARPGRIGIGIYLFWPVFYTDVTDSYRLTKAGRLRTDLGGVYFNALFALAAAAAYLITSYEPLLLVVVSQQILLLDQFIPWVRLDGYHIISDLVGVSDLFARIKPVINSLVPGRAADRRVSELKPWARAAVTTWVLTTIVALAGMAVTVVVYAPSYLNRARQSLIIQIHEVGLGLRNANVVEILGGGVGTIMLLLPIAGMTLTYLLLCRGIGTRLARRRAGASLTLPAGRDKRRSDPVSRPLQTTLPILELAQKRTRSIRGKGEIRLVMVGCPTPPSSARTGRPSSESIRSRVEFVRASHRICGGC
jgi:putative peptide zinc metalloprotease protein